MARDITSSEGLPRFPDGENMGRIFYVYAHLRVTDGSLFYIGKGKGSRALDSVGRNRRWINTASKNGKRVVLISEGMTECCAFTLEKILIGRLRPTCNYASGGEGSSGAVVSDDAKAKMRARMLGKKKSPQHVAAMMGRVVSDATRKKISASNAGKKHPDHIVDKMRNNTPMSLFHPDHGVVTIPAWKFAADYGLNRSAVTAVRDGRRASVSGWCVPGNTINNRTGRNNGMYDHTEYEFWHNEFGTIVCTRAKLKSDFGLLDSRLSDIIKGKRNTHKGWAVNGKR